MARTLETERREGVTDPARLAEFAGAVRTVADELVAFLTAARDRGERVVGFGATAKSATVLNYCGIGPDLIPVVYDSSPTKQGRVTPGSHIPVIPSEGFRDDPAVYAVLFAWNHAREIMANEAAFSDAGQAVGHLRPRRDAALSMRVLLVSYAERTTSLPLVPIAWGLRAAGHDVLVATQPAGVDLLAGAGLPVVSVGRDHAFWRVMRRVVEFDRDDPVPGFDTVISGDLDDDELAAGYEKVVRWWWRLVNDSMVGDLVRLARQWRPDVVVWETSTFAGAVAARASGAAHVRMVWSVDLFARLRTRFLALRSNTPVDDPFAAWLGNWAERSGTSYTEDLALGQATLTFLPASLRGPEQRTVTYLPVRFVPYPGRSVVPRWVTEPATRPRVAVSFGTTGAEHFATDGRHLVDVVAGLARLPAEVVVATSAELGSALVGAPGNVRVVPFVPLDALLGSCRLLINHGGPNTVATAVSQGVPQLIVPAEFDAPELAAHVERSGAGRVVARRAATPDAVYALAHELLHDPSAAAAADDLRVEARAMPDPMSLADELAALPRPLPTTA